MTKEGGDHGEDILRFGPFELFHNQRVLFRAGARIRLGSRAMTILIGLAERPGQIVSKAELMALAWPHALVDETNLRVHIAALRKLLGDGEAGERCIVNVTGQGYLFAPAVMKADTLAEKTAHVANPGFPRLLGRDAAIATIGAQLSTRRLITITGPAGVGKTSIARVIEGGIISRGDRALFVDLSQIEDPARVPAAVAAALDLAIAPEQPLASLIEYLRPRRLTILLDNCEQVIDAVAALAEMLIEQAQNIRLIATSREPLQVAGEWVHRLPPLDIPGDISNITAERALDYAAIRLFVERASDNSDSFHFGDVEAPAVADICVRLDGLPLAIELVAARIDLFGIRALASALDERLILVAKGSRTAHPRQQSIRGALDWSYRLLSDTEQRVLRRFAVFHGPFSLASAMLLALDSNMTEQDVLDALVSLSAKSLIAIDTHGPMPLYRLLRVTRAYAGERLRENGEMEDLAHRHAEHLCDILSHAEADGESMPRSEWLKRHCYCADDVRGALDWAFSTRRNDGLAARLTVASLPFGPQLSPIEETRRRIDRALAVVRSAEHRDEASELRLLNTLATLALAVTMDSAEVQALFDRIHLLAGDPLAGRMDNPASRIAPLSARATHFIEQGDLPRALDAAHHIRSSAEKAGDPLGVLLADPVCAQVYHHAGHHDLAKQLAKQVIVHSARTIPLAYSPPPIERRVTMRMLLARSWWIEGRTQDAVVIAEESLTLAIPEDPVLFTFALALGACPLAFWMGDMETARAHVDWLIASARRHTLDRLMRLGECFADILDRKSSPSDQAGPRHRPPATQMHRELLATCDEESLDRALGMRGEQRLCGLFNPEILRGLGEWHLRRATPGAIARAEGAFESAITEARAQGAISWELRAATSLARLRRDTGRAEAGRILLETTLSRLPTGATGADPTEARAILHALA